MRHKSEMLAVRAPRQISGTFNARGETVLVVEDNLSLRRIAVRQVRELGYRVLEADNATAALKVLERARADVLFTDIVMPGGMTGFELARSAQERWPNLRVVLTSGFPDVRLGTNALPSVGTQLLNKPYRKQDLAKSISEVLDNK
jgi:CheY-like chemotaxis protein